MISLRYMYLWALLFVGEYFIQYRQVEINQMVAEYERAHPEVVKMQGEDLQISAYGQLCNSEVHSPL